MQHSILGHPMTGLWELPITVVVTGPCVVPTSHATGLMAASCLVRPTVRTATLSSPLQETTPTTPIPTASAEVSVGWRTQIIVHARLLAATDTFRPSRPSMQSEFYHLARCLTVTARLHVVALSI
jgi:hypothetical protein